MPSFFTLVRPGGVPADEGVRCGDWTVVGTARLDNREEIRSWSDVSPDTADLALIASAIATRGDSCVRDILGDFAFVAQNTVTHQAIAARDAFGVRPLYYRTKPDELAFSSHAARLAEGTDYDLDYIAEFILSGFDRDHRTPYRGVRAFPPGHVLITRAGDTALKRYWSAAEFQPADHASAEESSAEFRALLERALISNLTGADDCWSQLSGGLDSSSLVSLTETMRRAGRIPHGIAGTVMMVDSLDDESSYARAVVEQYGVRFETITDYWLWQDDGEPPPPNDLPDPLYPMYARNRALCSIVRNAGGRVLFSGVGPDHFVAGNLYFFADWLARGRVLETIRELWRWSVLGKKPFWKYAVDNAIAPLLPSSLRRLAAPRWAQVYDWINPTFARRLGLNDRTAWNRGLNAAPIGHKFAGQGEADIVHLVACIDRGEFENGIEMRCPYLYRPFVEFCLRLPRELRIESATKKVLMREAMKGVLPEVIRERRDKGAISGRTRWAVSREGATIGRMLKSSILAELGCIDIAKVRQAVERARTGDDAVLFAVTRTLALEFWLQVMNQRWAVRGLPTYPAATTLAVAV
ncbi:MAG TPA: asparagine synthase-related protein [Gemmatimonadaceae bacterium]|nr:asparagine synthase-related protein [Gemmatimonadaceae bacterium]